MNIKQLSKNEVDKLAGYIYIFTEKRNNSGEDYICNDFFYTDLCRTSKPLILEDNKLTPYFQLLHMGGGMKPLEKYQADMIVGDDSSAIFTSQSATKVFKDTFDFGPCQYFVNLDVGKNSFVEYINDAVILYEGAKFKQQNTFYINDDSTLFYSEIFSSGYSINNTRHAYSLMQLKTSIYYNNELLVYDNLVFEPKKENPNNFGIMDNFERCGSGYFISKLFNSTIINELKNEIKQFNKIKAQIGISQLDKPGISVRVLANEVYEIEEIISFIHNFLRHKFFGLKALKLRKQ